VHSSAAPIDSATRGAPEGARRKGARRRGRGSGRETTQLRCAGHAARPVRPAALTCDLGCPLRDARMTVRTAERSTHHTIPGRIQRRVELGRTGRGGAYARAVSFEAPIHMCCRSLIWCGSRTRSAGNTERPDDRANRLIVSGEESESGWPSASRSHGRSAVAIPNRWTRSCERCPPSVSARSSNCWTIQTARCCPNRRCCSIQNCCR
jgi:hypothetical protein